MSDDELKKWAEQYAADRAEAASEPEVALDMISDQLAEVTRQLENLGMPPLEYHACSHCGSKSFIIVKYDDLGLFDVQCAFPTCNEPYYLAGTCYKDDE
jgi:hypothetical protein